MFVAISTFVLILDQLSKLFITHFIDYTDRLTFIPGLFDIVLVKNTGAAFSILKNQTVMLAILSVLISIGIIIYMIKNKPQNKLFITAASLLLGGALGNGIDRLIRGYVIDFIEFIYFDFPVFNIADIAITIGAFLFIISVVREEKNVR